MAECLQKTFTDKQQFLHGTICVKLAFKNGKEIDPNRKKSDETPKNRANLCFLQAFRPAGVMR